MVYKYISDVGTAREVLYLVLDWFWKSFSTSDSDKLFEVGVILSKLLG